MRKSRAITVTLLSALMLTACCVSMSGCGRRPPPPPDHTWYDQSGNRIPEKWKTNADGTRALDAGGHPIPDPHVPYDRYHRPWVFINGAWGPQPPPAGSSSSSHRSSSWLWGGSGYRSSSGGSGYRTTGGTTSGGGVSAPSGSSISRGGFGSTGMSSGS